MVIFVPECGRQACGIQGKILHHSRGKHAQTFQGRGVGGTQQWIHVKQNFLFYHHLPLYVSIYIQDQGCPKISWTRGGIPHLEYVICFWDYKMNGGTVWKRNCREEENGGLEHLWCSCLQLSWLCLHICFSYCPNLGGGWDRGGRSGAVLHKVHLCSQLYTENRSVRKKKKHIIGWWNLLLDSSRRFWFWPWTTPIFFFLKSLQIITLLLYFWCLAAVGKSLIPLQSSVLEGTQKSYESSICGVRSVMAH